MIINRKTASMLSLCQKAGKLASGELPCENSLKNGSAFLIIVAENASENTKKKFENKAFFYKVPICVLGTKEEIGANIGKDDRAVLAVCDENFALKIKQCLEE